MNKSTLEAAATLAGCVIGAGILGIPYVVAKAGFLIGIVDIIAIGVLAMFLNLFLGEIVLRTKGTHQLPRYAEIFLNKKWAKLMLVALLISSYGALIAYLIGEGQVLNALLSWVYNNEFFWSCMFFIFASLLVYKGIKRVSFSELISISAMILIIIFIGLISLKHIDFSNYTGFKLANVFVPYGVIMFAYLGLVAIPEVREVLIREKKNVKKAIVIGSLIPMAIYLLFTFIIIGVTGANTTEVATIGLGQQVGYIAIIFGNLFAFFSMFTSFLAIGLALVELFKYDLHMKKNLAFATAVGVPFVAFLLLRKSATFTKVLDVTGYLSGGLMGLLIVAMIGNAEKRSQRKPEFTFTKNLLLRIAIALILAAGIVVNLIKYF